jgi:hypothetical protein
MLDALYKLAVRPTSPTLLPIFIIPIRTEASLNATG